MHKISCFILFFSGFVSFAQQLSGVVTDGLTNEPIPGAKIELKELQVATYSDGEGAFFFEGDWPEQLVVEVSLATYETKTV